MPRLLLGNQNRRRFGRRLSRQTYAQSLGALLLTVTAGSPVIRKFERYRQGCRYPDQDFDLRGEVEMEVERMFTFTAKHVRNCPGARRILLKAATVQHAAIGVVFRF